MKNYYLKSFIALSMLLTCFASYADVVDIPNTFQSGTAAVAADVNDNFTAVKSSVDDNDARIVALETLVTTMQTELGSATSSITTLQQDLTTANSTITNLQTDLSAATTDITTLQGDLATANTTIEGLQQFDATVTASFTIMQASLDDAQQDILTIEGDVSTAQSDVATNQSEIVTNQNDIATNLSNISTLLSDMTTAQNDIDNIEANTVLTLDGFLTRNTDQHGYERALFTGVNVQIVHGGRRGIPNGLGNIIVGDNDNRFTGNDVCSNGEYLTEEDCTSAGEIWALNHKTGSHNFVSGDRNSYSDYGGAVFGRENVINRYLSTVLGGTNNRAQGNSSTILGGSGNVTIGGHSTVTAGRSNIANGDYSIVVGGSTNSSTLADEIAP